MATEPKTKKTVASVAGFLDTVADPARRADCERLAGIMATVTGEPAAMWGTAIVGFGAYHYLYASGHSGDWPVVAFSPRKQDITVYIMPGFARYEPLLARLGKHKTGKSCLYIKRLADVDVGVLTEIITESVAAMEPQRVRA